MLLASPCECVLQKSRCAMVHVYGRIVKCQNSYLHRSRDAKPLRNNVHMIIYIESADVRTGWGEPEAHACVAPFSGLLYTCMCVYTSSSSQLLIHTYMYMYIVQLGSTGTCSYIQRACMYKYLCNYQCFLLP